MASTSHNNRKQTLSLGKNTLEISTELFSLNRKRLAQNLRPNSEDSVVLLEGGNEISFYDTDVGYVFRQESFFIWCFGVNEAGCYGAIDVKTGEPYLFIPRHPKEYEVWMGKLATTDDFTKTYGIENVYYVDQLSNVLTNLNRSKVLLLEGKNSDSGLTTKPAHFEGIEKFSTDKNILYPIISELRVIKTSYELDVIKYVVAVSSLAHRHIMRTIRPGNFEYQAEAEFFNIVYKIGGCRHCSYTCICGSGANGAILHYGHAGAPNSYPIKDGSICLFDMGANYFGYAADITCSFPANGKFTSDQKIIYEAVLEANLAVQKAAKPGTSWVDMHVLSNRVLLENLTKNGLLQGNVDEMMDADLAAVFQPHGLGHFMGLDVHDVGGYLKGQPERPTRPGLRSLRTARILQKNMVLTIEPGCYFIDPLLDAALANPKQSKFLVPDVIKRFRGFGGVRIEDDVLITEEGVVNMTSVPRTVKEIEDLIAGKDADEKYHVYADKGF